MGLRPPLIVAVVRYLGVREVDGDVCRLGDDSDELRKSVSRVIEDGCARCDCPHVAEVENQREGCYPCRELSDVTGVESSGGDEMLSQWRGGSGHYFHEQGAFPQQLEHEGIGHIVGSVGEIVGPTAFSSLVCRWDWLDTDDAKRVTNAYRASRAWVNTADPMEVARAEADFFPGIAVEATAAAVAFYQGLGTWSGDIEIPRELYDSALDVFAHSGMVGARHPYESVVVAPPA